MAKVNLPTSPLNLCDKLQGERSLLWPPLHKGSLPGDVTWSQGLGQYAAERITTPLTWLDRFITERWLRNLLAESGRVKRVKKWSAPNPFTLQFHSNNIPFEYVKFLFTKKMTSLVSDGDDAMSQVSRRLKLLTETLDEAGAVGNWMNYAQLWAKSKCSWSINVRSSVNKYANWIGVLLNQSRM